MTYQKSYFKKNKYNAKRTKYNGFYYDSVMESNYAQQLDWRKKAGEIKEITPQFKIDLRVNDIHVCNYYIDFKLIMPDDSVEFHEVKGMETPLWRLKWKLTEALYPEYKLVLIK